MKREQKRIRAMSAGPALPKDFAKAATTIGYCDVPNCNYYGPLVVIRQKYISGLCACPEHWK